MSKSSITVTYHFGNKDICEIIKNLVSIDSPMSKEEIENLWSNSAYLRREKTFKQGKRKMHIFSGVLKCNECGGNMSYKEAYKGYKCTNSQKGGGICTSHSVKEECLLELIKESLKIHSQKGIDIEGIYKIENRKSIIANGYEKELSKIQRDLNKIEEQMEIMYLDKLHGLISDRSFENLKRAFQKRQQFLISKKEKVESLKLKSQSESNLYYEIWKEEVDKILSFNNIDRRIIDALIYKIVISENKLSKEKKIDIYYKFKE